MLALALLFKYFQRTCFFNENPHDTWNIINSSQHRKCFVLCTEFYSLDVCANISWIKSCTPHFLWTVIYVRIDLFYVLQSVNGNLIPISDWLIDWLIDWFIIRKYGRWSDKSSIMLPLMTWWVIETEKYVNIIII